MIAVRPTGIVGTLGDYAGCAGDGYPSGLSWDDAYKQPPDTSPPANGIFVANHALLIHAVDPTHFFCITRRTACMSPIASVTDGTSNTIMFGEKHVPPNMFGYRVFQGRYVDDNSIFNPDDMPTNGRYAGPGFGLARSVDAPPDGINFGSAHPGICQFALADGSVRPIPVDIDEVVLGRLASRNGGLPVENFGDN